MSNSTSTYHNPDFKYASCIPNALCIAAIDTSESNQQAQRGTTVNVMSHPMYAQQQHYPAQDDGPAGEIALATLETQTLTHAGLNVRGLALDCLRFFKEFLGCTWARVARGTGSSLVACKLVATSYTTCTHNAHARLMTSTSGAMCYAETHTLFVVIVLSTRSLS